MSSLVRADIFDRIKKSKNENEYSILVSQYIEELLSESGYMSSAKKNENYSKFIELAYISASTFDKLHLYAGSKITVTTEVLIKVAVTLELNDEDITALFAIYGYDYTMPTYANRCYYEAISIVRESKLKGKRHVGVRHSQIQSFLASKKMNYHLV